MAIAGVQDNRNRGGLRDRLLAATAAWVLVGAVADYDFRNDLYYGPTLSTVRAGDAYAVGPDGLYGLVAPNTLRREFVPRTPRVNFVRNSVAAGAVVGSSGTAPTNWTIPTSPAPGVSVSIAAVGDGVLRVRYAGTTTDASWSTSVGLLNFDGPQVIPALTGQTWVISANIAVVAGALPSGFQARLDPCERTSAGGLVRTNGTLVPLDGTRQSNAQVLSGGATTAFIQPLLRAGFATPAAGVAVDFTLEITLPQLEQRATASDPIRTFGVAGAADVEHRNLVRNNSGQGVVAGTVGSGGSRPTNYIVGSTRPVNETYSAVTSSGGIDYYDLTLSWTALGAGEYAELRFESGANAATYVPATQGQALTTSAYLSFPSGASVNGAGVYLGISEVTSAGAYISAGSQNVSPPLSTTPQRFAYQRTIANATAGGMQSYIGVTCAAAGLVSITLRIGSPQVEPSPYVTDPIRTTGTALTVGPGNAGSLGLLVEGAQTNSIRNNSMQGAVAGSPGTLPTNWGEFISGGGTLARQIVGVGAEGGIDYVDVRYLGTTAAAGSLSLYFETNIGAPALSGQLWTAGFFHKLVGGGLTNISSLGIALDENTSGGAYVAGGGTSPAPLPTSSPLPAQRFYANRTLSGGATVAAVRPSYKVSWAGAVAIDFTLRIGWPQLEQWSASVTTVGGASSPIRTTGTAATRAADVVGAGNVTGVGLAYTVAVSARATVYPTTSLPGNRVLFRFEPSAGSGFRSFINTANGITSGETGAPLIVTPAPAQDARFGLATSADGAGMASALNGGAVVTAAATATLVPNTLSIGHSGGGLSLFGYIERLSILPYRADNTNLQLLSALGA